MMSPDQEEVWWHQLFRPSQRLMDNLGVTAMDRVIVLIDQGTVLDPGFSHLVCNDLSVLHRFYKKLGAGGSFQDKPRMPHYDIKGKPRLRALELVPTVPTRVIIEFCKDFFADYKGNPHFKPTKHSSNGRIRH
jgi:hypothetical protein